MNEIHHLTGDGVDAVFDGMGGDNLWRSREALRVGGRVVTYGFQSKMRAGRMSSRSEGRHPFRESVELLVHRPQLVQARPKEHGAVQHTVADAV